MNPNLPSVPIARSRVGIEPAKSFAEELRDRLENLPISRKIVLAKRDRFGRIRYRSYGYAELCRASQALAVGLFARGVGPGTRTLVLVAPGFDFFTVMLALIHVGAVPVLLDPGVGLKQMLASVRDAEVEAMIGEPRAHLLRVLSPRHFGALVTAISTGSLRLYRTDRLSELVRRGESVPPASRTADDLCMIAYTSGSTGPAKGVEITYGNVLASSSSFRELVGDGEGMDLIALPPLALISLIEGRSLVMPDLDYSRLASARPEDLVHAIQAHHVTTSFGSPIVYRNLARYCVEHGIKLSSLRNIMSGGAPIPVDTLRQFVSILPHTAEFWTPYGATEAMPICAISARELLGETVTATLNGAGTCVGRPLPGARTKVIRSTDDVIERWSSDLELGPGEIGEIVVEGRHVTRRYFANPRATRLAKIVEPLPDGTEVVWHRTGDVGRFDEDGRVWFCGRTRHIVHHGDRTYYPVCVEGIFNAEPGVFRCALVGYATRRGRELALIVEPDKDQPHRSARRIRSALMDVARRHGIPLDRVIVHRRPLPTDRRHNSKIERIALTHWAQSRFWR